MVEEIRSGSVLGAIRHNLGAFFRIVGIGISGFNARTGLHLNFETSFGECGNYRGHQRNPPLPRINFLRNTNTHEACLRETAAGRLKSRLAFASEFKELRILVEPMPPRK